MISGANEKQLELANARANIVMKLDNTSTYESWLIIDTYIESLQQENQQLRIQISAREEEYRKLENNWNELNKRLNESVHKAINKCCNTLDYINNTLLLNNIKVELTELLKIKGELDMILESLVEVME